jgi:hypothetical protein
MADEDEKSTGAANQGATSPMEGALNALNTTSKNMQAIAGEIFDISKQSFEHTTQTIEKLRNARGMDEVVAIQTDFIKEAFEHAAQHARKFSELMGAFPASLTKTYQDAWFKSLDNTVKATESAGQTAAEKTDRPPDATQKTSSIFNRRESA